MSISEADVFRAIPSEGFLKKYVDYAMRCTDAHASYHLGTGLTALAMAAPIDLHVPFGTPVYGNLFVLNVGASSKSRKSSSISVCRDILKEAIPSCLGEQPGSREALVDGLKTAPRQVITYSEFGAFLAQTEKGYLTPLKTAYTEAYDCTSISRALVRGRGAETAAEPRLSLMCGCTVEFLERHTEPADWTGGFMARFLTFYADRERTYTVPPGDAAGRIACIDHLKTLNEAWVQRGQCLGFDQEARAFWDEWSIAAANSDAPPEVEGAVARAPMHGLRIALLLALDYGQVRSGQHWYITMKELEPARAIADLHIRSVLRVAEHLAPTRDMRERRDVLRAVKEKPRPLGAIVNESKLLLRRVNEILATLLEEGLIIPVAGVGRGQWFRKATMAERAPVAPLTQDGEGATILQFPTGGTTGASNSSLPEGTGDVPDVFAVAAGTSPQTSTGGMAPASPFSAGTPVAHVPVDGRMVPVFSPPLAPFNAAAPTLSPTEPLTFGFTSPDDDVDMGPPPPVGEPLTF